MDNPHMLYFRDLSRGRSVRRPMPHYRTLSSDAFLALVRQVAQEVYADIPMGEPRVYTATYAVIDEAEPSGPWATGIAYGTRKYGQDLEVDVPSLVDDGYGRKR